MLTLIIFVFNLCFSIGDVKLHSPSLYYYLFTFALLAARLQTKVNKGIGGGIAKASKKKKEED